VKILYRQTASDDIVRQFRYYLVDQNLPDIAVRFRDCVRNTNESLGDHPLVGAHYRSKNPAFENLRSWLVARGRL
jgi:plasmid stabilization system protein ParE